MKVTIKKQGEVQFNEDCIRAIYEDIDEFGNTFLILEGCRCKLPPNYFTVSFYEKEFDEFEVVPNIYIEP